MKPGDELKLTLSVIGFDENWNPVVSPLEVAAITIDGKDAGVVTDANGCATISASKGEHVISAAANDRVIVSPVCVLSAASAGLGAGWYVVIIAAAIIIAAAVVIVIVRAKKK